MEKTEKFTEVKSTDINNTIKFTNNKNSRPFINDYIDSKIDEENFLEKESKMEQKY